jgi:hypothetical protein
VNKQNTLLVVAGNVSQFVGCVNAITSCMPQP